MSESSAREWRSYRGYPVEVCWSGEGGAFLCRWREFPSAVVDGPTYDDAFAALMSLTPTFMCVIADLPRADVRDAAEVARDIAVALEDRVESLEALLMVGKPVPTHVSALSERPQEDA